MFKNLFNRGRAVPAAPEPAKPETATPALVSVPPKKSTLDSFREGWEDRWDTSHEVIESNGGDTEWGLWTEAKKHEENSFADTVLEDDDLVAPTRPTPLSPY